MSWLFSWWSSSAPSPSSSATGPGDDETQPQAPPQTELPVDPAKPSSILLQYIAKSIVEAPPASITVILGPHVSQSCGILAGDYHPQPDTGPHTQPPSDLQPQPYAYYTWDTLLRILHSWHGAATATPSTTNSQHQHQHQQPPFSYQPTAVHRFVALLASKNLLHTVITETVDELELTAGVPSEKVLHAHGTLQFACNVCHAPLAREHVLDLLDDRPTADHKYDAHPNLGYPPCDTPRCQGEFRPCVLGDGDIVPMNTLTAIQSAVASASLVLIIGSSLSWYPLCSVIGCTHDDVSRVLIHHSSLKSSDRIYHATEAVQLQPRRMTSALNALQTSFQPNVPMALCCDVHYQDECQAAIIDIADACGWAHVFADDEHVPTPLVSALTHEVLCEVKHTSEEASRIGVFEEEDGEGGDEDEAVVCVQIASSQSEESVSGSQSVSAAAPASSSDSLVSTLTWPLRLPFTMIGYVSSWWSSSDDTHEEVLPIVLSRDQQHEQEQMARKAATQIQSVPRMDPVPDRFHAPPSPVAEEPRTAHYIPPPPPAAAPPVAVQPQRSLQSLACTASPDAAAAASPLAPLHSVNNLASTPARHLRGFSTAAAATITPQTSNHLRHSRSSEHNARIARRRTRQLSRQDENKQCHNRRHSMPVRPKLQCHDDIPITATHAACESVRIKQEVASEMEQRRTEQAQFEAEMEAYRRQYLQSS
jgi:NAD-dependent SIR2 family protein deacetylase